MIEFLVVPLVWLWGPSIVRRLHKPKPCVMECPRCGSVTMGLLMHPDYIRAAKRQFRTPYVRHAIVCGTCKADYAFETFEAGKDGVFQIRRWECPQCQAKVPVTTNFCTKCHFKLF
jgi:hypothetical protein